MNENQSSSEYLSLINLILSLWNNKWIIVFVTLFCLLISYIFFYLNNSYTGTIEIEPLTSTKQKEYAIFEISQLHYFAVLEKNLIRFNTFLDGSSDIKGREQKYTDLLFLKLNEEELLQRFVEKFQDTSKLKDTIYNSNYFNSEEFKNKKNYDKLMHDFINSITVNSLKQPNKKTKIYNLKFSFNQNLENNNLIKEIILSVNLAVQEQLKKEFENLVALNQQIINEALDVLYQREKILIKNYYQDTESKVDYLSEQSQIAKKLDLKDNQISTRSKNNSTGTDVVTLLSTLPFYLNGYDAIDEEIELMQNRLNIKSFIPSIYTVYEGIEYFKSKNRIENLRKMFKLTPIYSINNFESVNFDINKIYISSKYNFNFLFIISLLLGFIASLIIIFLKDTIQEASANIKR